MVLRRNKSRPLLMMYQISMTVIQDGVTIPAATNTVPKGDDLVSAGLDSLQRSIDDLTASAARAQTFLNDEIIAPATTYIAMANTAMTRVVSMVGEVQGVISSQANQLIGFASDIAQAGRNAFYTYNAIATLPDYMVYEVERVASAFDNAFCVLSNAFNKTSAYPDYSGLYGASNCSSTSGGSPLSDFADVNTFDQVTSQFSATVEISSDAQNNITVLKSIDPVISPISMSDLVSRISTINSGVTLS
jgi:hypothetical protein